jgi:hypothetical protein
MKLVPENLNEAIKHLPGRSQQEILKVTEDLFRNISKQAGSLKKVSSYSEEEKETYAQIAKIFKAPLEDIYIVTEDDLDDYEDFENLKNSLESFINEKDEKTIKQVTLLEDNYAIGDWFCYPKKQIAFWDDSRQYPQDAVIFNQKHILKLLSKNK